MQAEATDPRWPRRVAEIAHAYRAADGHAARFARSKLTHDPVFRFLLRQRLVPRGATVVDLGCGQGLLAACLAPLPARVIGFDVSERALRRARALRLPTARFVRADMRRVALPACDAVACIDTLHYLPLADQDRLLQRACEALRPGGVLVLRVGDASAPLRWRLGLAIDRLTRGLQGGGFGPVHGRDLASWRAVLEPLGMQVEWHRMNGRLPFVNLLLVARRAAGARGVTGV